MSIHNFISENSNVRPNADIQSRWIDRVEGGGLHAAGARGADAYIGQYGKGMKAPKAVMFARLADIKGFPEMSARFWEHAYFMATGLSEKYQAGASSPAAECDLVPVALKESFGQRPELLTFVDYAEAIRLASDPRIGVQVKKDGKRLLTRSVKGANGFSVTAGNKKGLQIVTSLAITEAVARLGVPVELDGENVNGVYFVFDLLSIDGVDFRDRSYLDRYLALEALLRDSGEAALQLVRLYIGKEEKLAYIAELKALGAEGFVMKPLYETYREGENNQRKNQFRALGAFIVGVRNGAKNSVAISVYRPDGSLRDMGNLSIPANRDIPEMGSVVEVEYLYCHTAKNGKLNQPVFKEIRCDVEAKECLETKLRLKETESDE